ncbi:hypothetical protein DIPPA_30057 [Diplonema papillatum]|nr:hypothetical protein DIPPA_30057 [Diplonema papillatum]
MYHLGRGFTLSGAVSELFFDKKSPLFVKVEHASRELTGTGKPTASSLADDDLQSRGSAGDMAAEPFELSSSPLRQGGRALSFDSISVAVAGAE